MPGNLRYELASGLSTASKKRRPGSHYLESPFFHSKHGPELYTRSISSPAWDLIAHHRSSDSKLPASAEARAPNSRKILRAGVERVFILPEKVPRRISEFRWDFIFWCLLYGYYTVYYFMSPHFGAVLGRNLALFRALGSLHFAEQLGLSKSTGALLLEFS
jgi:hypothetical protein